MSGSTPDHQPQQRPPQQQHSAAAPHRGGSQPMMPGGGQMPQYRVGGPPPHHQSPQMSGPWAHPGYPGQFHPQQQQHSPFMHPQPQPTFYPRPQYPPMTQQQHQQQQQPGSSFTLQPTARTFTPRKKAALLIQDPTTGKSINDDVKKAEAAKPAASPVASPLHRPTTGASAASPNMTTIAPRSEPQPLAIIDPNAAAASKPVAAAASAAGKASSSSSPAPVAAAAAAAEEKKSAAPAQATGTPATTATSETAAETADAEDAAPKEPAAPVAPLVRSKSAYVPPAVRRAMEAEAAAAAAAGGGDASADASAAAAPESAPEKAVEPEEESEPEPEPEPVVEQPRTVQLTSEQWFSFKNHASCATLAPEIHELLSRSEILLGKTPPPSSGNDRRGGGGGGGGGGHRSNSRHQGGGHGHHGHHGHHGGHGGHSHGGHSGSNGNPRSRGGPGGHSHSGGGGGGISRMGSSHGGSRPSKFARPAAAAARLAPLTMSSDSWYHQRKSDDNEHAQLVQFVRSHVNKMAKRTYDKLSAIILKYCAENVKSFQDLREVVTVIFDAATLQKANAGLYASLASQLTHHTPLGAFQVTNASGTFEVDFRRILLTFCKINYESIGEYEGIDPELAATMSINERAEAVMKIKRKLLGNIHFLGHLYQYSVIPTTIVITCLDNLVKKTEQPTEMDVESAKDLLQVTASGIISGKGANAGSKPQFDGKAWVEAYLGRLAVWAKKVEGHRALFMVMDMQDMHKKGWPAPGGAAVREASSNSGSAASGSGGAGFQRSGPRARVGRSNDRYAKSSGQGSRRKGGRKN